MTTTEASVVDSVRTGLYIGGEWRDAAETLAVEDPSTGETIAEVADATADDAQAAIDAACDMQAEWAATAPRERGEILRRAFELITERADELALLMTLEMGKTVKESKAEIGRKLIEQSAENVLRVSMELGGNAPFLVFADADVDAAVEGAVIAKMRNVGEACTAANRFHVAESIEDEFTTKLAERLGAMKVGRGTEENVEVGPLIDSDQRAKVSELVEDATGKGAEAVVGGTVVDGPGYFYAPTVLSGVPDDARLLKEEIFGPVAPVATYGSEDEAIAAANSTEFGLVAYVYTSDLKRAFRVCERLETGMVGLNQGMVSNASAPFGGVKQSGYGREGGKEGIGEYLETKYVAMAL